MSSGYASAAYVLFHLGIGPYLDYPVKVTVYVNHVTWYVILWSSNATCVEYRVGVENLVGTPCSICDDNSCTRTG